MTETIKGIGLTMPITITSEINPILHCVWMIVFCYIVDRKFLSQAVYHKKWNFTLL